MNKKELKALDEELNSNNLTRVPDSLSKSDRSLFRALSLSVYYNENHEDEIIRILKSCLVCSCRSLSSSPFPQPQRKVRFLNRFLGNEENIEMYFKNPELTCFVNDNLELASLAFEKQVILFSVKDDYLNESLITACKFRTKEPPIMLAKRKNEFFCVQEQTTRSIMMFIKENIINQLINLEEDKAKTVRRHKKSFSDHGDSLVMSYPQQVMDAGYEYLETAHSQTDPHQIPMMPYESDYMYHYGLDSSTDRNIQRVPANQRYTGKLKFFDHNGNYGFIVVDGFGCDLFVHYDDLQKTGIPKQRFFNIRNSQEIRFEFTCLEYDGKNKKSKKAVDLVPLINQY